MRGKGQGGGRQAFGRVKCQPLVYMVSMVVRAGLAWQVQGHGLNDMACHTLALLPHGRAAGMVPAPGRARGVGGTCMACAVDTGPSRALL